MDLAGGGGRGLLLVSFTVALGVARQLVTALTTVRHAAEALGWDMRDETSSPVAVREHRAVLDALEQTAVLLAARTAETDAREAPCSKAKPKPKRPVTSSRGGWSA